MYLWEAVCDVTSRNSYHLSDCPNAPFSLRNRLQTSDVIDDVRKMSHDAKDPLLEERTEHVILSSQSFSGYRLAMP